MDMDWDEADRLRLGDLMSITPAQTISVLNHLGIADLLTDGPRHVDELASQCGAHAMTLYRLLRFAASNGVFAEVEARQFGLTGMASFLRSDAPGSMWWRVDGETLVKPWLPWEEWLETVKTGEPAYDRMHGRSYWEALTADADARAVFDMSLRDIAARQIPQVMPLLDLGGRRHIVDVGTGEGSWLAKILATYGELTGAAVDLEQAVSVATRTLEAAGVADRATVVPTDFFESVPTGDVILLANVLHDWDDDRAALILANCRRALAPGGVVIIVDRVLPEGDAPHHGKAVDINMLFLLGGRERTLRELRELLDATGLSFESYQETELPVCVVTATA